MLAGRTTCRNFEGREIPQDVMNRLYAAACSAATAGGFQRVSIVSVKDGAAKKTLMSLSRGQGFIARAPVNLIFCADNRRTTRIAEYERAPYESGGDLRRLWMGIVDATIAAQTLALAAELLGLASCYNGNVIDSIDELSDLLALPGGVVPVIMLTLGYPKTKPKPPKRYRWQVMVHDGTYRDLPFDELYAEHMNKSGRERYPLTDARLEKLLESAGRHGEEYAASCAARAREQGYLSAFQYWFGCYYPEGTASDTARFLDYLAAQGFDCR